MRRVNPTVIAVAVLGLLILVAVALAVMRRGSSDQDKLSDREAAGAAATGPQARCASQATYDRIKDELFRQAAQVRKSDQAAFDRLSAYASVRMQRPLLRSRDDELGTVRCTGHLSLDLPPGVAVVGGRRTLSADIDYVMQPAADGSGDVVLLEGADPIVLPLATLSRVGGSTGNQQADVLGPVAPGTPVPPLDPGLPPAAGERPPPPAVPQANRVSPSFNCRYARSSSEIAVCSDPALAALDRQMAEQYFRALSVAGPRQRVLLTTTRGAFLRFRDQCPSEACIAETYRGRMREIRDVMAGTWRPQR